MIDERIRETYAKDSKATNKNSLSDMYVKFFRWAADRLDGRDGIVCFVSNNSFVDQIAFDGMRKHLLQGLSSDRPHRPARQRAPESARLSGTTHNVFGIQVGVGITLAVKKKGATHAAALPPRARDVAQEREAGCSWRKGQSPVANA